MLGSMKNTDKKMSFPVRVGRGRQLQYLKLKIEPVEGTFEEWFTR